MVGTRETNEFGWSLCFGKCCLSSKVRKFSSGGIASKSPGCYWFHWLLFIFKLSVYLRTAYTNGASAELALFSTNSCRAISRVMVEASVCWWYGGVVLKLFIVEHLSDALCLFVWMCVSLWITIDRLSLRITLTFLSCITLWHFSCIHLCSCKTLFSKVLLKYLFQMVDLKQDLNVIDYFGVVAVWLCFFSIVFIISVTCILWCCVSKDDDQTVFAKVCFFLYILL